LRRFKVSWFTPPAGLPPRGRWLFIGCALGFPISLLSHVSLVLLFDSWNIREMVLFNLGSVVFWAGTLFFFRRHLRLALLAGLVEIIVHAAFCVHYVGWDFSAQYTLLPALIGALLLPGRRWLPFLSGFVLIVAFIGMYLFSLEGQPVYALGETPLLVGALVNMALIGFGLTAAISLSFVQIAENAELALEREYARSEALLHNVLPVPIARRLKQNPDTIAEAFPEASILFADLVDFTGFAERLSPGQLVSVLGDVFSGFDDEAETLGVEKIKTLGDAYMAAAGIPVPRADHADALALLALAMLRRINAYNRLHHSSLSLRVGIHSGPVVAGVIGKKRFLYDLWGDSVNIASRMQSHGVPGRIQVSDATRTLLGDAFLFEDRGEIVIKGKGQLRTWLLLDPENSLQP
jgi:class 3 adenylate cyclase